MLAPPGSLRQTTIYRKCSACKTKFPAPLEIFQGAHRFEICTWLSNFHTYLIIKLCRQQAEVTQNSENANVNNVEQGEPLQGKYKRLELGGGQTYDRSSD
jgi:hypothetical protein